MPDAVLDSGIEVRSSPYGISQLLSVFTHVPGTWSHHHERARGVTAANETEAD